MLADMAIGVESARLCYMKAAWMADQVNKGTLRLTGSTSIKFTKP